MDTAASAILVQVNLVIEVQQLELISVGACTSRLK